MRNKLPILQLFWTLKSTIGLRGHPAENGNLAEFVPPDLGENKISPFMALWTFPFFAFPIQELIMILLQFYNNLNE